MPVRLRERERNPFQSRETRYRRRGLRQPHARHGSALDDVLGMARLEKRKVTLEPGRIDVGQVVADNFHAPRLRMGTFGGYVQTVWHVGVQTRWRRVRYHAPLRVSDIPVKQGRCQSH